LIASRSEVASEVERHVPIGVAGTECLAPWFGQLVEGRRTLNAGV
jgi:hypothetical protein